jgi:hypothetical protein
MKRISALAAIAVTLAGCASTGQPRPAPVVTVTKTASPPASCGARMRQADPSLTTAQVAALCEGAPLPVPTVTRTVTRQVTRTVTEPGTFDCFPYAGKAYLTSPGAGVGAVPGCTITVSPVLPMSTGQAYIVVTAPDGSTLTYVTEPG